MTDQPANLAEALALLQTDLPAITKNAESQVGGGRINKYADLASISSKLLPKLGELGLSFSAKPTWVIRDNGDREFVLAYTLRHVSGEHDEGEYPLGTSVANHQQLGSAITYGRRYCLCAITGAVAEDDDDGHLASQQQPARSGRGKPPIRPFDELPRNLDGSLSRSKCTNEELAHYGAMDDKQQRQHNKLERDVLGIDSKGKVAHPVAEHLPTTPDDDPWLDTPTPTLRAPQAAPNTAGAIHAYFKRLGPYTDEERYGAMTTITGRRIRSTNDLTAAEGLEVKKFLAGCRDGDVLVERLAAKAAENNVGIYDPDSP